MEPEIEQKMGPYLAQVFSNDLDTDWKYIETLYQAFKQRLLLELEQETTP